MKTLYAPIHAKDMQEYYLRAKDLEARGYEPHVPMRKTRREIKSYELLQDSQGRRFSKNQYKGSHDYHGYTGVYKKVGE